MVGPEHGRPTGFTLVELLIALALTSTIVTMVYGSYAAASRSLDLYGSRLACWERTSLALRLMARQIRGAYVPPSAAGATSLSPGSAPLSAQPAAFRADTRGAGGEILSFITAGGFGPRPDSPTPLARVLYRYDPAAGILSVAWEPYAYGMESRQEPGLWRPLLGGVRRLELQFHDGRQWQSDWDSRDKGRPPHAVKIALTVIDEKDRPHEFQTAVPVGCRSTPPGRQVRREAGKP
jgi:general secretion pathway protein J